MHETFDNIFTLSNFVMCRQFNNNDIAVRNQEFPIVTLYQIVFPEACTRDLPIPIFDQSSSMKSNDVDSIKLNYK